MKDLSASAKTCKMCILLWLTLKESNPHLTTEALEYNNSAFESSSLEHGSDGISGRRLSLKMFLFSTRSRGPISINHAPKGPPTIRVKNSLQIQHQGRHTMRLRRLEENLLVYAMKGKSFTHSFVCQEYICLLDPKLEHEEVQRHGVPQDPRLPPEEKLVLMRKWMSRAVNHGPPSVFLPSRLLHIGKSGHVRLIQTSEERIEDYGLGYVALSHRWGASQHFTSTKASINHKRHGFLTDKLPATFRDAVHVSSLLGFSYLWIDALCIIQDDIDDWKQESVMTSDVFAHAGVVVFAHCARGDSDGFFEEAMAMRPSIKLLHSSGMHLALYKAANMNSDVTQSPLCMRGWVLQELFVAQRSIHFTAGQIYLETGDVVCSENTEDLLGNLHPMIHRNAGSFGPSATPRLREVLDVSASRVSTSPLHSETPTSEWLDLVMMYSRCRLTKPEDKLMAIAGMAKKIHDRTLVDYYAGIWNDSFCQGLLWLAEHSGLKDPGVKRAPSWSWAAYDGPIQFLGVVKLNSLKPLAEVVRVERMHLGSPLAHEISCNFLNGPGALTLRTSVTFLNSRGDWLSKDAFEKPTRSYPDIRLMSPVHARQLFFPFSILDRGICSTIELPSAPEIGWVCFDMEETTKSGLMDSTLRLENRPGFCFAEVGDHRGTRFGILLIRTSPAGEEYVRVGFGQLWKGSKHKMPAQKMDIRIV